MVQESAKLVKERDSETRKWSKPIMEKRRRERINRSLEELKRLVLEAQNRDTSRYTKLEKADILEMTVRHLRSLRHQRAVMSSPDPLMMLKYRAGYSACVAKMSENLLANECLDPEVKAQVLSHLACYPVSPREVNDVDQQSALSAPCAIQFETAKNLALKEPARRLFDSEALEFGPSSGTAVSPYVVPRRRILPSTGTIPVHYVPISSTESCGSPVMHHGLTPSGASSGLHLTDPLWRPW